MSSDKYISKERILLFFTRLHVFYESMTMWSQFFFLIMVFLIFCGLLSSCMRAVGKIREGCQSCCCRSVIYSLNIAINKVVTSQLFSHSFIVWLREYCCGKNKRQILWFSRRESTYIRCFEWSSPKSLLKEREILAFSRDRNNISMY